MGGREEVVAGIWLVAAAAPDVKPFKIIFGYRIHKTFTEFLFEL